MDAFNYHSKYIIFLSLVFLVERATKEGNPNLIMASALSSLWRWPEVQIQSANNFSHCQTVKTQEKGQRQ